MRSGEEDGCELGFRILSIELIIWLLEIVLVVMSLVRSVEMVVFQRLMRLIIWKLGRSLQCSLDHGLETPVRAFGRRMDSLDFGKWSRGGASFKEKNGDDRTTLVLEPRSGTNVDTGVVRTTKPSPFGAARLREEVLSDKGLDWKKIDLEIEAKGLSRPTSSQSSGPNSARSGGRMDNVTLQGGVKVVVKPKPRVNPFGDAKPREVLLEEKGKDWRKFDMQLERRVERPETEEETILKEEISQLKKEKEKETTPEETGPDAANIRDTVNEKEKELEQLAHELDDKIRFGQKSIERPGFSDRPPSCTGSEEAPKSGAFMDRPRSRGTADVWSRPSDERRSFQRPRGRERGSLGNRDMNRTKTQDRW